MASNPYVNKVIYGNDTVMDISDTTATEGDVISGKTFYKASGARSTGSAVIPDISNCYETTDTAETTIDDADYFPFYDSSATAKRKSLWSNIKSVLKTYFDSLYALASHTHTKSQITDFPTIPTVTSTYSSSGTDAVNGTAVNAALQTLDVSDSAVSGKYVSAVSETDGKISVTRDNLPTASTEHSGTASTTGVRKQTITINSVAHDVDGSAYMESTANSASFTFTNSAILTTSAIDVYTDTWGDNPSNVTVSSGRCDVTFSAAKSRTVRIYIK